MRYGDLRPGDLFISKTLRGDPVVTSGELVIATVTNENVHYVNLTFVQLWGPGIDSVANIHTFVEYADVVLDTDAYLVVRP